MIVDEDGTEWEVYDERQWTIGLALEGDYLPQSENPGLIFVSSRDRRRLWPCPDGWQTMSPDGLLTLLAQAKSIG